jgi:hypothetical protein
VLLLAVGGLTVLVKASLLVVTRVWVGTAVGAGASAAVDAAVAGTVAAVAAAGAADVGFADKLQGFGGMVMVRKKLHEVASTQLQWR